MRHEYDCDYPTLGICTCGAVNMARRSSGTDSDITGHEANLRKFKAALDSEKAAQVAAALAPDASVEMSRPYIDPRTQRPTRGKPMT